MKTIPDHVNNRLRGRRDLSLRLFFSNQVTPYGLHLLAKWNIDRDRPVCSLHTFHPPNSVGFAWCNDRDSDFPDIP